MRKPIRLLLTCEHGGKRVPKRYSRLFRGHKRLLASHRGYDPGSLALARRLAAALRCPLIASTTTRLLVDLNRAPTNRSVFSEVSRSLAPAEKVRLLANYHTQYRNDVAARRKDIMSAGDQVLHIAVHSLTPRLRGVARNVDIGLLYDPARARERRFCECWQAELACLAPDLRVRRNYPYRGTSDGLPTWLRKSFTESVYMVAPAMPAPPVSAFHWRPGTYSAPRGWPVSRHCTYAA